MTSKSVRCSLCGADNAAGESYCSACGKSLTVSVSQRRDRSIILLPVVLGCGFVGLIVGGIVAAILIPNLLDAMQKARQKRSVADVRVIGTAWQSWAEAQIDFQPVEGVEEVHFHQLERVTYDELASWLVPDYLDQLPELDGWENPYEFFIDRESHLYAVRANGDEGGFECDEFGEDDEGCTVYILAFEPTEYWQDVIWTNGEFLTWPE